MTSTTLAALLSELGYDPSAKVATAVNGDFVPKPQRAARSLSEADRIEIVAPKQGG